MAFSPGVEVCLAARHGGGLPTQLKISGAEDCTKIGDWMIDSGSVEPQVSSEEQLMHMPPLIGLPQQSAKISTTLNLVSCGVPPM